MYYALICTAAVLFAVQFLFHQKFQERCGTTWSAALTFSLYTNGISFFIMLMINRFHLEFSWFSLGIAALYAIVNILYVYASIKAFATVNLSVYSLFAMLGGMLLPFAYGILFYGEPLTGMKLFCGVLIIISLLMTVAGGKKERGGVFCYIGVFVLNGMVGVLSKLHQSNTTLCVDSGSFMAWANLITFAICFGLSLASDRKITRIHGKTIAYVSGYAAFCGIGNLLVLIALAYLPASVQYPIITGGVIVCSTIISALRKEAIGIKHIAAAALALISTVLIIL